ncbi:MAG: TonB-dependent receptor [Sphingobium sp.]|nr:TonB-dependent receptor [Sphingobium sp.]
MSQYYVAFALLACSVTPATAQTVTFAIPAGPLSPAMTQFSRTTGLQLIADPDVLKNRQTQGVKGIMSVDKGLKALLRGTGLTARRRGGVVLIMALGKPKHPYPPPAITPQNNAERPRPLPRPTAVEATPLIVIGQRIADQLALRIKKQERNIVDAVASDEVRRLPDTAIVDTMRRIPGISVLPIADNEHPRDVPIAPVVRGLTQAYNNVTINGLPVASTGIPDAISNSASRGVRLDILPASLVSRLLVIKTFTPDLDPNAIGGAIDLQIRSPFDNGGKPFFSAEGGLSSLSQRGQIRSQAKLGDHASAIISDSFGPDGRIGFVLSASYQHLENNSDVHGTSDSGFLNFYDDEGRRVTDISLSNGIAVPRQDKYWYNESRRKRWSVTASAEADLDDLQLSALIGDYRFIDGYTRNEVVIDADDATLTRQTATSGHFDAASVQVGYRDGTTRNETRILQFNADWQAGEKDQLSLRGGISRATMREAYDMIKYTATMNEKGTTTGTNRLAFDYDTSGFQHSFSIPADAYYDLSLYQANYWRHRNREAKSSINALRADWHHNMDAEDEGIGFASGLAWTKTRYSYVYRNAHYTTSDRGLTLADAGFVSTAPMRYNHSGLSLLVIDPAKAWQIFNDNSASITLADREDDNHQDNFIHRENIGAGYAMLRYASGPLEMTGGVRMERTATRTMGAIKIDDLWSPITTSSHYNHLLPSLLVNYEPAQDVRLRAAYSRTIGRPGYEAYAPRSSVEFSSDANLDDPNTPGVMVSLGNPNIKPRISNNFDISAEWTLPRAMDGMLSAALFHKAIDDEIFDATTFGYSLNGVYYNRAEVTRPANATAAHISGLELNAAIGSLGIISPVLRHVGFNANWTWLRGALTVPVSAGTSRTVKRLIGQPSEIRNISVFYSNSGFEVRGAMNWSGKALRSLQLDTIWQDIYWAPRRQFDLQARYHFGPSLSMIFDIANVTEERLTSLTGPDARWLKDSYSIPRTFRLSINWNFGRQ